MFLGGRASVAENVLRKFRTARGWTQVELARRVHINNSLISRIEAGKVRPWSSLRTRLADALGVPVIFLEPLARPLSKEPNSDTNSKMQGFGNA